MAKHNFNGDWVDRYIRDELSAGDEASFEEALLEDSALQAEVETALGIREALKQDSVLGEKPGVSASPQRNQWTSLAMAASVLLALVSTTLYWRSSVESGLLQEQVEALKQPRSFVLQVPVNITRSSSKTTPDVIIQKPPGPGAMVLNIELSPAFQNLPLIHFTIRKEEATPVLSWTGSPTRNGRATVVLTSESVPEGLVHLVMSDPSGETNESRLLEFRPPAR